jgi:hypothetical protein
MNDKKLGERRPRGGGGRGRSTLVFAGAITLAFASGAWWQFLDARPTEERLQVVESEAASLNRELARTRALARVGVALSLVHDGRFEAARQSASGLFTELQSLVDSDPDSPSEFSFALARRDEIITALSRSDPAVGDELTRVFRSLAAALGREDLSGPLQYQEGRTLDSLPATGASVPH